MDEHILICLFVLLAGACVGSFLNVVALRGLSKESIVFPSSKCPKCNTPIKWYDNIPVLSYFLTVRGKCRNCGEKISIQYPIVEALTSILFICVFLAFGISLQTLLLLILLCISVVITITDIKEEVVIDSHSWIFIITAIVYSALLNGLNYALIGCLSAAVIMEILARVSYYLIRKKESNDNDSKEKIQSNSQESEDLDITKYIKQNKRAFGEGDTYLAAGVGALLGLKYFVVALACAIIFQAICVLPQFLINLYKQKETKLLISISSFIFLSVVYFILSNLVNLNIIVVFIFIVALIYLALNSIKTMKNVVNKQQEFQPVPFGPALLFLAYIVLFFAPYLTNFIKRFIFMIH